MPIRDKRKRAKPKSVVTPHDALFYKTFSVPKNAAAELRCVLDKDLVAAVEWDSLTLESSKFVGAGLTSDCSDVLYSVRVRGCKTFFHILFEHESRYKPWSLLQALRYQVDKWEEVAAQPIERGDKRLPPILTVVLHHGDGGWRGSTQFRDYFKVNAELTRLFAPYLVDYRAIVDDVARIDIEALLQRPVTFQARLTLICFRFVREPMRLLAELLKLKDEVREFFLTPEGSACITTVFTYLAIGAQVPKAELDMAVQFLTGNPDIDEILDPGRAKRLLEAKGKRLEAKLRKTEEALRQAELAAKEAERTSEEAQKRLVLQQIERRFGPLSPNALAQLQAVNSAVITEMAMRVLTAKSLDEVLPAPIK